MGCNCKNDKNDETTERSEVIDDSSIVIKLLITIVKVFIFLIAAIIGAIIVIPFTIVLLFKSIFFNRSIDVTNMVLNIVRPFRNRKKDNDDDNDDDFEKFENEEDLILLNEEKWYKI